MYSVVATTKLGKICPPREKVFGVLKAVTVTECRSSAFHHKKLLATLFLHPDTGYVECGIYGVSLCICMRFVSIVSMKIVTSALSICVTVLFGHVYV